MRKTVPRVLRLALLAAIIATLAWIASAYGTARVLYINIQDRQYIAFTARGSIGIVVSHPWPDRPYPTWQFRSPKGFLYKDKKAVQLQLEDYAPSLPAKYTDPVSGMGRVNPRVGFLDLELPKWLRVDWEMPPGETVQDAMLSGWLFCPPLALLAIVLVIWEIRRWPRGSHGDAPLCPTCSYDLRAHQPGQKCPECGAPIALPPRPHSRVE